MNTSIDMLSRPLIKCLYKVKDASFYLLRLLFRAGNDPSA